MGKYQMEARRFGHHVSGWVRLHDSKLAGSQAEGRTRAHVGRNASATIVGVREYLPLLFEAEREPQVRSYSVGREPKRPRLVRVHGGNVVRIILIGNGYFGSLYQERIMRHKEYELVGVVDSDYEKLKALSGLTIAESYDAIANNVEHDAVVICTTPQHHAELSINAMNRGKHVLCMKPGMMSLTDYERIYEAHKTSGVGWMIDYTQLAAPEMDFLDQMTLSLGDASSISLSRHVVTPPKAEGILLDLFPHDLATTNIFFFKRDVSVNCKIDGVRATATICDSETGKQYAFLSASYNATIPQKYTLLRLAPFNIITNPRIELAWEQNQKFVEVRSQGRSVEIHFRHNPDMITMTLNSFRSCCEYNESNTHVSKPVMRMIHAMQHSASMNGASVECAEIRL